MDLSLIVVVVIVTALAFDFTDGFHDTANAMATSIATKALTPRMAVIIAASRHRPVDADNVIDVPAPKPVAAAA
jgi:hypothetical protein